ncbi:hypothetical protein [Streptomyces sp. 3211.6]|uniref:hypothetical protein n=1 Tax=Streptomyces sp. 3211.6 TaxID=1938845 RepID=UPI0011E591F6|nr:hypothetical protein [Streptomyces sp. 3211.6]
MAQRFAEATGVAPTLEKPHRGRIQLRHKVGSWELLLVWSRKRSGGWTTQWQPTLTHNGERRPLFAGLTSYTTAVSALPSCPPTVEVVQAATEIPDTVRAQRDREIAADSAHEWVIRAGRVGNRWVVASVGQEIIAHWYFVERDGQWLRDPLDPLALWDDVGECTTELMPLLRRQFAQPTDGTSRELLSGWRATRAPTPAPTLSPVPGSSVNVRLRL